MKKKPIIYSDLSKQQLENLKELYIQKKVQSMSHQDLKKFVREIISYQINDAIDKSIPAIGAMETALEMAQDSGNDKLAKMIEKDLSDAKIRLNSGKDLSYVKDLQSKYAKFIKTEGLAYESKLAIQLNQQLK